MKITIEIDTLRPLLSPSWEKLQDLLRSMDDVDAAHLITLVSIERADKSVNYRGNGEYRISARQGEQGFAGTVTVEGVRD